MRKAIILFTTLFLLNGCATTYSSSARSQYVGNGIHEIAANGNGYTSTDQVRHYLFRKAFETCAAEDKGFVLVSQADTSKTRSFVNSTAYGVYVNSYEFPGGRALVKCEGPIDQRLEQQFSREIASEKPKPGFLDKILYGE